MSLFGKNIRKIRNVKNLSQQALADIFDLKRATLGAYEEGRSEPKIETLIRIANHFSITIDELLTKELTVNDLLKFKADDILNDKFEMGPFPKIPFVAGEMVSEYVFSLNSKTHPFSFYEISLPYSFPEKRIMAFEVFNLEMSNINSGMRPRDIVVGVFEDRERWDEIPDNSLVVAVTSQKVIIRRWIKDAGIIVLKADNTNFDDLIIEQGTEILEVWKVTQVVLNQLEGGKSDIESRLSLLEKEMDNIKKQL